MRVVCSRCGTTVLETVGREPGESHGLCRACLEAAREIMRARREARTCSAQARR